MSSPLLAAFFRESYRPLRLLGRSAATVEDYTSKMMTWAAWHGGGTPVSEITDVLLVEFLADLAGRRAPATVNHYRRVLLAVLRFAKRRKLLLDADWLDDIPKVPEPEDDPDAYLAEEVEALVVAARRQAGDMDGIPARNWWPALILTIWNCGTRITATMSVRCEDVCLDRRILGVRAARQKTNRAQWFTLGNNATAAIAPIWCPHREVLLPWPFDPQRQWQALTRRFRKIIGAAGLEQPRQPFHKLRRSSGSYIDAGGGNAQRHLGHKSAKTTERYLSSRITGLNNPDKYLPDLDI